MVEKIRFIFRIKDVNWRCTFEERMRFLALIEYMYIIYRDPYNFFIHKTPGLLEA